MLVVVVKEEVEVEVVVVVLENRWPTGPQRPEDTRKTRGRHKIRRNNTYQLKLIENLLELLVVKNQLKCIKNQSELIENQSKLIENQLKINENQSKLIKIE